MIEIKTTLEKKGKYFRIILPKKEIEKIKAREGDELIILMKKNENNILRKMFGTHKFSKPTEQLMKEMDKELDIEF